ncbi:cingulin-like protein 1, partial [Stylophora pistillata]
EAESKLEQETNEANTRLKKRNEEIEERVKEIDELRRNIKTLDQQKFQELDKVWKEMMSMQKTIEDRNKTIDELEQNIRKASVENEKSREQIRTLADKVKTLNEEKNCMEGNLRLVSSDAGKDKDVIANLKKVLEEQDIILAEQGQALDERQGELETLSTELQTWQEKNAFATKELDIKKKEITNLKNQAMAASDAMKNMSNKNEVYERSASERMQNMEKEIAILQKERATLEEKLVKKDEEISKMNDSRDNIMKTMRQTLEVANAKKAEYEIKLSTIREQCKQDLRREMEEELRKTKRDYQRQLDDKDRSIEEIKHEKENVERELAAERSDSSKTDPSSSDPYVADKANPTTSCSTLAKKCLKRNSSDIPLAQLKTKWTKAQKTEDSDEDFTPGPSRKTRSRANTRQYVRTKQTTSATKSTTLPAEKSSMDGTETPKGESKNGKLFQDLQENTAVDDCEKGSSQPNEETENIPPKLTRSSTKKGKKLFKKPSGVTALSSPAKQGCREVREEQDSTRTIIARQLRPRAVKYF